MQNQVLKKEQERGDSKEEKFEISEKQERDHISNLKINLVLETKGEGQSTHIYMADLFCEITIAN